MANDESNSGQTANPSSRMRLADKFQRIKNGINLHHYSEFGEDKGDKTQIVEAEHGGKIVGRFVSKNGELVESHGSEDSQASGTHEQIAKKLGVADDIIHTKPEQVSEIAHEERHDSIKNKDNQTAKNVTKPTAEHKLDNCDQVEKVKFPGGDPKAMKQKEPLDKALPHVNYHMGQQSESYDRGGAPVGAPTTKKSEPLQKKWKVFMDSCSGKFRDPLKKEPNKLLKSMQSMIEVLRKSDVSNYEDERPKHPVKSAYEPAREQAKKDKISGKKKTLSPSQHDLKYWVEVRKQHKAKHRQAEGKKMPKPGEAPKEPKNKVLDFKDKTKKSSVNQAAKNPNQASAKTPTIQNVAETTLATAPVGRNEGLAKDKKPKATKTKATKPVLIPENPGSIRHSGSVADGLEQHKQDLINQLNEHKAQWEAAASKEAYSGISAKDRDAKRALAERKLNYMSDGIRLMDVAIRNRDTKNPTKFAQDMIGMGNAKVNQLGTVVLANTLPGHSCPGGGGCKGGWCYGIVGRQGMGGARELRARNTGHVQRNDFVQRMVQAIKNMPQHMDVAIDPESYDHVKDEPYFHSVLLSKPTHTTKTVKGKKVPEVRFRVKANSFRWHDTGDIINQKHADDMYEVMKHFPDNKFYAYTKSLHLNLDKLKSLPNFNMVQSEGGEHDHLIDKSKPHTHYFDNVDDANAAGYNHVWYNDLAALTGKTNVALVPHGARVREAKADVLGDQPKPTEPTEIKKSDTIRHLPPHVTFDQPDSLAQQSAMGIQGKMRAMSMLMHKHDEPAMPMQKAKHVAPKVEIQPHPPEVIDVDPKIIADMKSRLAPKEPIKKGDVVDIKSKLIPKQMEANRANLQNRAAPKDEFSSAEKKMKQGLSYDVALNSSRYDNQPGNPVLNMILASKKKKDDIKKNNGDEPGATIHQINEATQKRPAQVLNFINEWNKRKDQRTIDIQKRRGSMKLQKDMPEPDASTETKEGDATAPKSTMSPAEKFAIIWAQHQQDKAKGGVFINKGHRTRKFSNWSKTDRTKKERCR